MILFFFKDFSANLLLAPLALALIVFNTLLEMGFGVWGLWVLGLLVAESWK